MIKWRNPKKELPKDNQEVFVMVEPHKNRLTSVQIVAGWASTAEDYCYVDNSDELGMGSVCYWLKEKEKDNGGFEERAIAWVPLNEIPYPEFYK